MARGVLRRFQICGNVLAKRAKLVVRNCIVGRAELRARMGKLGDIFGKFKNKFLKTAILGEFVVLFVLTARKFGALTVHIKEIIMTKNSAQRGRIG